MSLTEEELNHRGVLLCHCTSKTPLYERCPPRDLKWKNCPLRYETAMLLYLHDHQEIPNFLDDFDPFKWVDNDVHKGSYYINELIQCGKGNFDGGHRKEVIQFILNYDLSVIDLDRIYGHYYYQRSKYETEYKLRSLLNEIGLLKEEKK